MAIIVGRLVGRAGSCDSLNNVTKKIVDRRSFLSIGDSICQPITATIANAAEKHPNIHLMAFYMEKKS